MATEIRVLSCMPAKDKCISQVARVRNPALAFCAKAIWNRATGRGLAHWRVEVHCRSGSVILWPPYCLTPCCCCNSTRSSTRWTGRWQWGTPVPHSSPSQLQHPRLKETLHKLSSVTLLQRQKTNEDSVPENGVHYTTVWNLWVHLFQ